MPKTRRDPHWFATLAVGDVIAERSGTWRVVRKITRSPNGRLWGVTLTIQRCSWTRRCYTVITRSDLLTRGFRLIPGARWECRTQTDKLIHAAIHQNNDRSREPHLLTCCDVEGIA